MATRRARIKAVASLPVRRKGPGREAEAEEGTGKESGPVLKAGPVPISALSKSDHALDPDPMSAPKTVTLPETVPKLAAAELVPLPEPELSQSATVISELESVSVSVPVIAGLGTAVRSGPTPEPPEAGDECSFDPIIPLPTAKLRPKLRPVPKLLSLRRNSLQGSASETEEASEVPPPLETPPPAPPTPQAAPLPAAAAPRTNRAPRARTVRTRPPPPHQALTMYDLIFYNPPNNALKREEPAPPLAVSEPPPLESPPAEVPSEAAPVPQVKLGPNGEIVIDEQSLVIETSEALRSRQRLSELAVVWDGGGGGGRGAYGRGRRCREWSRAETLRFYRALHTLGTDFSLMLPLFPNRSRRDLKVKFKKEEKQNGSLVDRALMNPLQFDIAHLEEEESKEEAEEAPPPPRVPAQRRPRPRNTSQALQSLQEDNVPDGKDKGRKRKWSNSLSSDSLVPPPSPLALVPPDVEPGSLVIMAGEAQGELRAFVATANGLCPVALPPQVIRQVASKVGVTHTPSPL